MSWKWKDLARRSAKWLTLGWFLVAAVIALYFGMLEPRTRYHSIAEQRASGLGAIREDYGAPLATPFRLKRISAPVTAANLAGLEQPSQVAYNAAPAPSDDNSPGRELVRTASLDLVVQHPAAAADKIRALAKRLGGYLETSQVSGDPDSPSASLTIRVPAARFEAARADIRKLGLRVEDEKVDAQDVTKQYIDQGARLRNLQAEERQYLAILKRAATVKDTLEVSGKLDEVRSAIEQQQAEFDALSRQTETVAIAVTLSAEADAQVFGLHWRPLYRLKMAARQGLEGLGAYLSSMTSLVFYLPTILLWFATVLIGTALVWRILRRCWRVLFVVSKPATTEKRDN